MTGEKRILLPAVDSDGAGAAPATKKPCLSTPTLTTEPVQPPSAQQTLATESRGQDDLPDTREVFPPPPDVFGCFLLFCPISLVNDWAAFINQGKPNEWRPTYAEEVYVFFGILFYIRFSSCPTVRRYWVDSRFDPAPFFTRFMSEDRFLDLYRSFCPWDSMDEPSTAVYQKFQFWSKHIYLKATAFWKPSYNVGVYKATARYTDGKEETAPLPVIPLPDDNTAIAPLIGPIYSGPESPSTEEQDGFCFDGQSGDGEKGPIDHFRYPPYRSAISARKSRVRICGESLKNLPVDEIFDAYSQCMNGIYIRDRLSDDFVPYRSLRLGGKQAILFFCLLEITATYAQLLQKHSSKTPAKSRTEFRWQLIHHIFHVFGQSVAFHNQGV